MSKSGVYLIRNLVNGKRYVGSAAKGFQPRWTKHQSELRLGKHHSPALQAAWNMYGEENFVFEVHTYCSPEECVPTEQKVLDAMQTYLPAFGYNCCRVAASFLGMKHTEETKRKISQANKGKPKSEATKQKLAESRRNATPETRRRLSEALKGKKPSDEARRKMSQSQSTPEARKANSERAKKQFADPEVRARLSLIQKAVAQRPGVKDEQCRRQKERCKDPAVRERLRQQAIDAWKKPGYRDRYKKKEVINAEST